MTVRGSRKHVLDWTASAAFCQELLELIRPVPAALGSTDRWMPNGLAMPDEARLETFGPAAIPSPGVWSSLRSWWLAHEAGANTPNWDIALSCAIEGTPGLVLVEAKANVRELSEAGKRAPSGESAGSAANDARIARALDEASAALRQRCPGVALSRETHYQLSNRIAHAWKLASLGIPTVLVYLGFIGDEGIADAGEPFSSDEGWRTAFARYAAPVCPARLFERRVDCGAAPAWFLVRSREVLSSSPARGVGV